MLDGWNGRKAATTQKVRYGSLSVIVHDYERTAEGSSLRSKADRQLPAKSGRGTEFEHHAQCLTSAILLDGWTDFHNYIASF